MNEKLQQLIDGLAEDLKETVMKIEARPMTTKDHYGDYGALLSQVSGGNKNKAGLIALALVKAGANRNGVSYGLKLFV